ncbi:hypothetical protein [Riemerella anatipestifer]|uniref:Polysaccharide deacetylase n=2 Tax=Riemerella anatipestifer TaxID=34085 RepID=A0A161PAB3_RIEAN|nr:hypothetical protein [Riemerella anatipestifer]ADQ82772.1 hypothetical protein Riean_1615 [Riemerella anatipestifer ATCC 11845 = DSM 15868]ADZ11735.1 hypothetical protein RIA_0570 [Riemerella anatipestifer RA-GD]AFD56783.1 hypothetical protein RA0C_1910 [Riemerella anatipestifer ATCC 11845 = DSM 15868]AGC41276.1 hypothetical protein G148_1972 [Riemerella anatipestifer RA-CH-2]AKP69950.1 hypothetical protein CG08_1818 [Riemerella anatipestifer]
MTSFWLFLSDLFKWSFGFYDAAGNVLNWVLFLLGCGFFIYWCYTLVVTLGGDKDKEYHSPTEGKFPYYDTNIYKKEG